MTATAKVKAVKYFELTPYIAERIKAKWNKEIGIDMFENWEAYKNKKYCTLIGLAEVKPMQPLKVKQSNGSSWIIVKD